MKVRVMLVRDGRQREGVILNTPEAAFRFLRPKARGLDRETLWRIDLDARNHVLGFEVVSVGSLTASIVHPREVLKCAILANAAGFILSHNLCDASHKLCNVKSNIM
jgi:DNA repair protein RadC